MEIHEITDAEGRVVAPEWMARAERVHRQLRDELQAGYRCILEQVFAGGGRMCVAAEGETVTGVAVWRAHVNTVNGLHLYVDDLVTDDNKRSSGVGRLLMDWLEHKARSLDCNWLTLDSAVSNAPAHRFYFRERMNIRAFKFAKRLK